MQGGFLFAGIFISMKKNSGFEKFQRPKKGSALKEQLRQEKKQWKKEREEYFNQKRRQTADDRRQKPEVTSTIKSQISNSFVC